jgi:hypothetical protein
LLSHFGLVLPTNRTRMVVEMSVSSLTKDRWGARERNRFKSFQTRPGIGSLNMPRLRIRPDVFRDFVHGQCAHEEARASQEVKVRQTKGERGSGSVSFSNPGLLGPLRLGLLRLPARMRGVRPSTFWHSKGVGLNVTPHLKRAWWI